MRVLVAGAFHPLPYTLGGRVRLLRPLAVGGMAEVFVAELLGARGFRRQIVAKRIRPDLAGRARSDEMFEREAAVLASLQHEHIVDVIDFVDLEGGPWLLMEQVDGPSLRQLLARHRRLSVDVVTRIVADAARALDALHGAVDDAGRPLGLVHRDLSPDNLVVTGRGVVKLLDFGIVKGEHSPSLTTVGALKGKLVYMAPEQLQGGVVDARADLWALGVTAHELLAGVRPFVADSDLLVMDAIMNATPRRLVDVAPVPRALSDLVGWLLEKDPAHRPGSARLVADLLDRDRERRGPLMALARPADRPTDLPGDDRDGAPGRVQTASMSRAVPPWKPAPIQPRSDAVVATPADTADDNDDDAGGAPADDDRELEVTMRRLRPAPAPAASPTVSATGTATPTPQPGWWSLVASLVDDDVVELDERSGLIARVPLAPPGGGRAAAEPTLTVRGPRAPSPAPTSKPPKALSPATSTSTATASASPTSAPTSPATGPRTGVVIGALAGLAAVVVVGVAVVTGPPTTTTTDAGVAPVTAPVTAPVAPPVAPPVGVPVTPIDGPLVPVEVPAPPPAPTPSVEAPAPPRPVVRAGRLTVLAVPFAEVFLDGRSIGVTPIDGRRVDAGRHRLRLVGPGGEVNRDVTVQANKTATVRVAMP